MSGPDDEPEDTPGAGVIDWPLCKCLEWAGVTSVASLLAFAMFVNCGGCDVEWHYTPRPEGGGVLTVRQPDRPPTKGQP